MNIFVSRGKKCHEQQDYYHAFNHGAHAAPLFHDKEDFERFLVLLYIANNTGHFILRDMKAEDIFATMHTRALVDITAYCLLPDHYHIILRDRQLNGTRHFIHKVGTAYVMYYNRKYDHKGTVFAGTYRARRVPDQSRLYELIGRIHLYPFSVKVNEDEVGEKEISKDEKKERLGTNMKKAVDQASQYEYSSMRDYLGEDRPQKVILTR
jgi:putative transposase